MVNAKQGLNDRTLVADAGGHGDISARSSPLYQDVRDRLFGKHPSAGKRRRLADSAGREKLIWIYSGATRASVRLGVELARAIAVKRPDVTVTLTFKANFPDLLEPLQRSVRIEWMFGPADYAHSINTRWRRLMPFAMIVAGVSPGRNLLSVAAMARHALLVAPPLPAAGQFERIYPTHAAPCGGSNSAQAAELDTLLVQTQIAPALAGAVGTEPQLRLWWWHGADVAQALRFVALFRGHLRGDLLALSGPVCHALARAKGKTQRLSTWNGNPIDPDVVVLADDDRWLTALAGYAVGAHFAAPESDALWQSLSAGAYVSTSGGVNIAGPHLTAAVGLFDDETDVAHAWARLRHDPLKARIAQEASRRAFLAERRLAQNAVADLLDRVLGWS